GATWPDTKTKPFAAIACEYGAPRNGAGAASVRTTVLSATCSSFARRLRQGDAQRLEDRLEHVLRLRAVQQPDVQRQACAFREPLEEPARDVGSEAADAGLGEAFEQPVEHRQAGLDARRAAAAQLHANPAASRRRHFAAEATGACDPENGPFGPCVRLRGLRYSTDGMTWLGAFLAATVLAP